MYKYMFDTMFGKSMLIISHAKKSGARYLHLDCTSSFQIANYIFNFPNSSPNRMPFANSLAFIKEA
ncbi:Uncharacterised protein [Paenibacillus macerans]|uniref:Uncharacterized protein n=1 Tax=Paenibacillus macerans TaxID=44252 RepID=A0A090ZUH1_PAEMA|nr:hypothetical protein DJ90_3923 [Paenibacillus macerans]SUD25917.1 Uncharacterised protein [Paenibacillus macerans]